MQQTNKNDAATYVVVVGDALWKCQAKRVGSRNARYKIEINLAKVKNPLGMCLVLYQ